MDALTALLVVLAAMIAGVYFKAGLDATLLVGVVLASLLFGRITHLPSDAVETLFDYDTISLMLMLYFVFLLNNFLASVDAMKKVVAALEEAVADERVIIASVPALIGLIPSPSGAVLSAPFADEVGRKAGLSKERRLVINYWFRHVSEYVNPIYPGVILAVGIVGVSFHSFLLSNAPVVAAYVLLGVLFYVAPMGKSARKAKKPSLARISTILVGVAPILAAVSIPILFNVELYAALIASILVALLLNLRSSRNLLKAAKDSLKYDLILLVFLVMLFKNVLDRSDAAAQVSSSLLALGVPPTAMLVMIPMAMGFLTGLTIGYVGLSFPILLPLLHPGGAPDMAATTIAFVSGYLGVLMSPMHLCLSVTQKYFKADMREAYRLLAPALILTFAATLVYAALI